MTGPSVSARMRGALEARPSAILSDYDGTLATLSRGLQQPGHRINGADEVLSQLADEHLVVVMSTRSAAQLRELLPAAADKIWFVGNLGAEWLAPRARQPQVAAEFLALREPLAAFEGRLRAAIRADQVRLDNHGWILEAKYRYADDPAATRDAVLQLWNEHRPAGFELLHSRWQSLQVIASALPGKGGAVRHFVGEHDLRGVVVCGDDRSDWPAFREVERQAQAGRQALAVLVSHGRPVPDELSAQTTASVARPADLVRLLRVVSGR